MHLKRIEIAGFKSFPDPTEVIFGSGVTAVVGPNGCGKSNLTDAVRWVLGEQRPRVLRGGKMEEVIFGGTPQRAPLSASEVTLLIDNSDGELKCDFEEVAVTRRLDRSGQSDYRLNRAPCRLKDINDLFMDTGMGSHAYSVIQQGMVDAIISENTDEVRYLFEEAAGVSKYKTRKRAAIRKLDATEADLIRLTDLKNEVATHTRSLARQKGKAERFRRLQDELKDLRLIDASRTYRRLNAARGESDAKYRDARDRSTGMQTQFDALELEWQSLRLAAEAADKDASEAADRLAEATERLHGCETRLVQLHDRRQYLASERTELQTRGAELTRRQEDLTTRAARAAEEQAAAERTRQEEDARTKAAEDAYRELKEQVTNAQAAHARLETEYAELSEQHTRLETEQAASIERRESKSQVIQDLKARQAAAAEAAERHRTEAERLKQDADAKEAALATQRGRAAAAANHLTELRDAQAEANNEVRLWGERLHEWREARDLLAEMIARGEGLGAAAEAVLTDRSKWEDRVSSFSDRLKPHPGWEQALEVVLSDRIGAILCEDDDIAASVTAFLRSEAQGRAVVLDPSLLTDSTTDAPRIDDPTYSGSLLDKLDCDDAARPWAALLFQNIAATENAADARRLFETLEGRHGVVSKDGVYIEATGTLRTGTASGKSILGRTERLEEMERKIADGARQEAEAHARIADLEPQLDPASQTVDAEREKTAALEQELAKLRLTIEGVNARTAEHERARDEFAADLERQQASLADDELHRDRQIADGDTLRQRLESFAERKTDSAERVSDLEERLAVAGTNLNEARVRAVETAARFDAAVVESRRLSETATDIEEEKTRIAAREQQCEQETASIAGELETLAAQETDLKDERKRIDSERSASRATALEKREAFSAVDIKLKEMRRRREEADQARSQIEIERSRLDAEIEQFRQRMLETVQTDPAELPADESPLTDDELKESIAKVIEKIEGVGPVNPLALEEYEREKQRWDFFENQIGDLRAAKKELTETITELNRTAGQRFIETFETARAHFQEVFTELFRGGEADVRLLNPDDPLESPMEIFARPRGKKFIGLRQLSGGERALTALALLFGLYLVKPSPFCILDEVDAPLDDANCGRFLRLIHRFKNRTQFIIVTHNKLTMEAADTLYGVTMEQSGVSKIVSVRLNRGEEGGEPGLAEPRIELDANGTVIAIETEPATREA